MSTLTGTPWGFLSDPVAGVNVTAVYLQLRAPDSTVSTVTDAMRHVQQLPRPITPRIVSAPGLTVQLELCARPQIIAGRSPHRLDQDEEELREILRVLAAHGLQVTAPA
ncbi:hypothetical protein D5045_01120 [Verminephrobacter eiseniae]|uniref:hypothetical protein n=1 Tax=Verminephrobacter eiseniae TaxID=364317 RepID=UPI002238E835|nr:hypothetical protein [Verminephrobacter eiseniae]MCW5258945.1 hypothetical protein [Verminephrobacter eiseniae]